MPVARALELYRAGKPSRVGCNVRRRARTTTSKSLKTKSCVVMLFRQCTEAASCAIDLCVSLDSVGVT